jgi:hypothetical protein
VCRERRIRSVGLGVAARSPDASLGRRLSRVRGTFAGVVDELIIRPVKAAERTEHCLSLVRAAAPKPLGRVTRNARAESTEAP